VALGTRTGVYELQLDDGSQAGADAAIEGGIYNEDMAVAIVDEVERGNLVFQHWSCTGQMGLGKW
jgi:putative NADH-flavin reductase